MRKYLRKIQPLVYLYNKTQDLIGELKLRRKNSEVIFNDLVNNNKWCGKESLSGTGSDLCQTRTISAEIPMLLKDLNIRSMIDIPCGDFNWMKTVSLEGIQYKGLDIVKSMIENNRQLYGTRNISFEQLDLLRDSLPKADLVFCRDCLVHFSYKDIYKALNTIAASGSTYLVTTTFIERGNNRNIATGQWRPLNLEAPPFSFPQPVRLIVEGCTECDGSFADKSLGVWKIAEIQSCLKDK